MGRITPSTNSTEEIIGTGGLQRKFIPIKESVSINIFRRYISPYVAQPK